MLKISWPSSNGIQSYDESKFEKVGNFYVPTCLIFAGPVTYSLSSLHTETKSVKKDKLRMTVLM